MLVSAGRLLPRLGLHVGDLALRLQSKLLCQSEAFSHTSCGAKCELESFVHPTSVVHPNTILGQGVSVGPFCTIGAGVRLGSGCQLHPSSHIFGDTELGLNCILLTGAVVGSELPGRTTIGNNNVIGHHAVVGVQCQDLKYKFGDKCFLEIGDNNDIREHVSIHRSSKTADKTVIGSNNLIMGSCHIAHDCKVGDQNIFANNTLLAGHVVVEVSVLTIHLSFGYFGGNTFYCELVELAWIQDYVHTAGASVVHQFCHIGSFAFVGGGSVIAQDVPKFMMVSGDRAELRGLNLEGLRRHGFLCKEVRSLKKAYQKIFMSNINGSVGIEERLAQVAEEFSTEPFVTSMVQSVRDSFAKNRRGICKYRNWNAADTTG